MCVTVSLSAALQGFAKGWLAVGTFGMGIADWNKSGASYAEIESSTPPCIQCYECYE